MGLAHHLVLALALGIVLLALALGVTGAAQLVGDAAKARGI